ncbi:hypothetical protein MMC18_009041 [Xylographa bjoerkii]|nr:hypothetical protein [Xylographa bjoerkii]
MASVVLLAAGSCLLYYIALGIYRLYFHPLAKFPGPRLAALTLWYEFYFDVIGGGRYLWKVKELHEKHGPIVRINPMELHINDPEYFPEIYAGYSRGKTDKFQWWMHVLPPRSTAFTADHDLHRMRRGAISSHFSKRSIQTLEPLIKDKVDKLVDRLRKACSTGEVVNMSAAYAALTMDVISRYSFGESMGNLEKEDYGIEWTDMFHMGVKGHPVGRQYPWVFQFFKNLPPKVLVYLNPLSKIQVDFESATRKQVRKVLTDGNEKAEGSYRTIFHDIQNSDLPDSEKGEDRLTDEAFIFITAGTETTARTLAVISFHLMDNPDVLQRLREELKTVLPKPDSAVSSSTLENLPYMHAIVSEGLRISHAFVSRLPRISRDKTLQYGQWQIPKGVCLTSIVVSDMKLTFWQTPVSQSTYMVHMNEDIFPEPNKFKPQRWVDNKGLDKYMVAWSRGTRICLGMNLAYAEIYLALAAIYRQFDVQLFETTQERDVDVVHDYFIGMPQMDSPAAFRALLPSDYHFVFVDGPTKCDAAPGIAALYEPPYLCWYKTPTTTKIAGARRLVLSIIEEKGPFDAVMGFSQGAAVAASIILHHQLEHPLQRSLFRVAIFFCSPLPFAHSLDYGIDTRTYFGVEGTAPSRDGCPTIVPKHLITDAAYLRVEEECPDVQGTQEIHYQMFHPSVDDFRIEIPTAHIFGLRDPWYLHSGDVLKLCLRDRASVFEHDYGHEVPRFLNEEICDVIETAVARAASQS